MKNNSVKIIDTLILGIKISNIFFQKFIKSIKNTFQKKNPANNEELTKYINKIFEQQEKERIARWLVNSIRESLDFDTVLSSIVEEIGKLLKVDRCLIALFEKSNQNFYFRNEYKKTEKIISLINEQNPICEMPKKWQDFLIRNSGSILVNNYKKDNLDQDEIKYLRENNIKSLIIIPVVNKDDFLGIIMVHQVEYQRKWEEAHFEILKDTGSQMAVAIGQAILYSKIQETTRLKSDFLTGMSHELRTPLNAVIGFSEMLLSENYGKLNKKQKKFLSNISISGDHLLRLVNDVLDLSKIESGNMEINYETFNVCIAIEETVSVLKSLAIKKNLSIKMSVKPDLIINADLTRFKQIMYNLLSNAIKFTEEIGKITVKAFKDGENIKVEVYDDGIGISQNDKEKIFKNFRQLDSALTKKQEGTGLGLKLTRKLIELHNGKIDFESKKDKGSKFWFILPESPETGVQNPCARQPLADVSKDLCL